MDPKDWTISSALAWLDDHVNMEKDSSPRAASMRLGRIEQMLQLMGDPQTAAPVVHITGTNGKGSTARMVSRLLTEKGLTTGTYLSPHLERVNERILWDGEAISDEHLAESLGVIATLEPLLDSNPTWFEVVTAAAFRFFADVAVDAMVIEVGLGGRYDATNVADGAVAVITNVSLDHQAVIGPTRADIAREKAGIIKPGAVVVLGEVDTELESIFDEAAADAGVAAMWRRGDDFAVVDNQVAVGGRLLSVRTPGSLYEDLFLPAHGSHQADNVACAIAAAEAFFAGPLDQTVVEGALGGLELPGRLEVVGRRPLVVIDGAHNAAGAAALGAALDEDFDVAGRRIVVFGVLGGHEPADLLDQMGATSIDVLVATEPASPRAVSAADVARDARGLGIDTLVEPDLRSAIDAALGLASEDDLVVVTGSLYLVGSARRQLTR
ncbi:MAG: bifunctional folylpolyglutamate synthase/dihydrofolate synthase [Acidimicrobiia bacterium]